jgi:hypothetical protein
MALDSADYAHVPQSWLDEAAPEKLRLSLIDVPFSEADRSLVGYKSGIDRYNTWIAVTPREYKLLARHIPALARTALNTTLDAPSRAVDPFEDVNQAAAERSGSHAVEAKLTAMQALLERSIEPRRKLINDFLEMASYPNLNRGNRITVMNHFEQLRITVFGEMLLAVGNQRKWTRGSGKPERAEQAILTRLYIAGSPAERAQNFRGMVQLSDEYYGHKWALVKSRIKEAGDYLRDNPIKSS